MKKPAKPPLLLAVAPRDARQLIRLLGLLQTFLESAIEACVIPGTEKPGDDIDRLHIAADRRDWKQAEDLIKRLSDGLKPRKKPTAKGGAA